MAKLRITVLTPTYNRAYIIGNLYLSLQQQSFTDFEWLVVDDGSADGTEELFESWKTDLNPFVIRYYKKANGGKHTAVNCGLDLAEGDIFFVVDSDDTLTPDALQKIHTWFLQIEGDSELKGIAANKGISSTQTPNHFFSGKHLDKSLLEMECYIENGLKVISGERALAFYTDFHKKYRYPVFEGERFVTEAVVYNRMAHDGYKMRFYNDIIWVFEYKEDGLTRAGSKLFLNNPRGYGLWLREKAEFQHASLGEKLKMYYTFTCDLSSLYSSRQIAEFIGAPYPLIVAFNTVHKLKHFIRK